MVAVIYRPNLEKRFGKQCFAYPIRAKVGKGQQKDEIELDTLVLDRGTNFVNDEVWSRLQSHGPNGARISEGQASGVFRIHVPDAETIVGATSDWTSVPAVREIVMECDDVTWLKRSAARDQRPEVFEAIKKRLDDIEENRKARQESEFSFI